MARKSTPPYNPHTRSSKRPRQDVGPSQARSEEGSSRRPRSGALVPRPLNWDQFRSRPIHHDKGIDLDKFRGLFISDQVTALDWGQFVTSHHPYSPQLVRGFYARLNHDSFTTTSNVTVRGCRVNITADRINSYYGLHPLDSSISRSGMLNYPWNTTERRVEPADYLRIQPRGTWITTYKYDDLSQGQLNMQAAFWCLFVTHSIRPTQNRTSITPETVFAIYYITNRLPIDVGYLIFREMRRPSKEMKLSLFFPHFITQLCIQDGVAVADEGLEIEPLKIGVLHYNTMARERDFESLPLTGAAIPDDDEAAPDGEESAQPPPAARDPVSPQHSATAPPPDHGRTFPAVT